ncbi:MAG: hypothetical protein ACJAQ8_002869 [Haliea salexigens]|jgi:hypothetical protein
MTPEFSASNLEHEEKVQLEISCHVLQRLLSERGLSVCELRCLSTDSRHRLRNIVKTCSMGCANRRD